MDAFGRFLERRDRAESGFSIIWVSAADAAEVSVVMRNTWTSWKTKYEFWTKSSILDSVGTPACRAHAEIVSEIL